VERYSLSPREARAWERQIEKRAFQPSPRLKPLPVLDGFVPEGWKDALYE